jgi:lactoylglutathione lyase
MPCPSLFWLPEHQLHGIIDINPLDKELCKMDNYNKRRFSAPNYKYSHEHLMSPDPQKTAEFYEQTFGAKRISPHDGSDSRASVKLDLNGVTILINQPKEGEATGLVHFGIRTDKLDESVAAMKEQGIKFSQDITQVRPDFKISFLMAPEGVSIELQQGQF